MDTRSIQPDQKNTPTRDPSMEDPTTVLVVDDESDIRELIEYNLIQQGYKVLTAKDGPSAINAAQTYTPDLIILDVMMPGLNGIEVAKLLRTESLTSSIPIIMLTALAEENNEIEGLDSGADDYISKPFSMQILLARVKAFIRRKSPASQVAKLSIGSVTIDLSEHQTRIGGNPVQLTITEFRLLATLIGSKGRVFSRPELITHAIGQGVTVTERTVDVHITALRKKLGDHAHCISTVRGVGYRADDP